MSKNLVRASLILLLAVGAAMIVIKWPKQNEPHNDPFLTETKMQLTSSAFANNQNIPAKYTCDGENVNPPLSIAKVPPNAKSLVLIVDDPDAPAGDWVHWTIWNIDPSTGKIDEGKAPEGTVEGLTDFDHSGYGGPCPPSGTHRYQFKLYALNTTLDLSPNARKKDLEQAMNGRIIDQTVLVGLYKRP